MAHDGGLTISDEVTINIIEVEFVADSGKDHVIDAGDAVIGHAEIGHWGDDDGAGGLTGYDRRIEMNDETPRNFIDQDSERFHIRVTDQLRNVSAEQQESIAITIGTLTGGGAVDDDMTTITLIETGPNTGVFTSESQLLMSPDLPLADHPDDVEPVHSNITRGTVPDNLPEDRTHRTTIDGSVRAEYQPFAGTTVRREIPVCNRSPEERRLLLMRAHVFNDPHLDTGFDHDNDSKTDPIGVGNGRFDYVDVNHNGEHNLGEPSEPFVDIIRDGARNTVLGDHAAARAYVNAQVARANIAWAQACIKVQITDTITFEDAPQTAGGVNIIEDGRFNYPADNDRVVATRPAGSVSSDVLEVYFVPPIFDPRWAGGITVGPSERSPGVGENTFVYMGLDSRGGRPSPIDLQYRILAHEIGHVLTNGGDDENINYIFYPALNAFPDIAVHRYRRITHSTELTAREIRPAGDLDAPGNRLLRVVQ